MPLALGIDTGGTYTDAVLVRDEKEVVASAKALTTRQNLSIGISEAVGAVLLSPEAQAASIGLVSLSTTLATNALVEGQGGRIALIYVGFRDGDIERHGLTEALAGDPVQLVAGGHTHSGQEATELDIAAVDAFLDAEGETVSAFAVASVFSTRNPAHEQAVAERIRIRTGLPVTCSHHLSAKLNGPKRAVTAVLNARLIGMIERLISDTEQTLTQAGIEAPLMVVRGDGALMSAEEARRRPIETILSGPAASIVGACWLTGAQEALVSDIGGTTTDVAMIRAGKPKLDPQGARVGAHRTMVEAVAMQTTGLGGDSQVHLVTSGLGGGVTLGPRRVLPISLVAQEAPREVHRALDQALNATAVSELDACFVMRVGGRFEGGLEAREETLLSRFTASVLPLSTILRTRRDHAVLTRLWDRGYVRLAGITPTDASHALGYVDAWDGVAARKALDIVARRRVGSGNAVALNGLELARKIVKQLQNQTNTALLETIFAEDEGFDLPEEDLVHHPLLTRALAGHTGAIRLNAAVNMDVIGLGASAGTYYPEIETALNCKVLLPEHGHVANAIGAVVGRLSKRIEGSVTAPTDGVFRAHLSEGPRDFSTQSAAIDAMEAELRARGLAAMTEAGAAGVNIACDRDIRTVQIDGHNVFVEAEIRVDATGRPRIASE